MTTTTSTPDTLSTLTLGHDVSDTRRDSLSRAIELGADLSTLETLRDTVRISRRSETIVLPPHHFEGLSRGRGWCRKGRGDSAEWGERTEKGYRVGPGHWTVGGHDGFTRKKEDVWVVRHIPVGPETWTIAD